MLDLAAQISASARAVEDFLDAHLSGLAARGVPARLLAAMRHGTLGGGKRLRPFLVVASGRLFGLPAEAGLVAGAALEMVHCYSLIHDDLPDMDNDEMRRGQPSVWKRFDPALAILAGDALLTEAFALLADPRCHPDAGIRIALVAELARAAGGTGMVGGQVLDIEGETQRLARDAILAMQAMKTGALIESAASMGAVLGGANEAGRLALRAWARQAGLAFQVADDILDVTQSSAALGKTAGKDADQNKSTLVAVLGLDGARALLRACIEEADRALAGFGAEAETLNALVRHFAGRQH